MRSGEGVGDEKVRRSGADWSILEKYAENERRLVDERKHELVVGRADEEGDWQSPEEVRRDFEREKSERTPSKLRKLGRAVLGVLGVEFSGSKEQQNREAMARALEEREDELVEGEMGEIEAELAENVQEILEEEKAERTKEEAERAEAETWEADRENRERDLLEGMEWYRRERKGELERERAQESFERELNKKLTKVEEIREQAEAGNPEVGKRVMDYMGQEVEVFDLKGLPYVILTHAVDYRMAGKDISNRRELAEAAVKYPEIWARNREMVKVAVDSTKRMDADTLSTSYANSESNIDTRMGARQHERAYLCYGFDHTEGDAVLKAVVGDAGTPEKMQDTDVNGDSLDFFERAEGSARVDNYNEVALRRYLENGEARKPDYIVTENGYITEAMLKHAAFFKVPIINIERSYYDEKFHERAEKILQTVDEKSDFREVEEAVSEIAKMGEYRGDMMIAEQVDGGVWTDWQRAMKERIGQIVGLSEQGKVGLVELLELEVEKRLDFVQDELDLETEKCQKLTEKGEEYQFQSDWLKDFKVKVYADGKEFSQGGVRDVATGEKGWADVKMTMKRDGREIKTQVFEQDEPGGRYDSLAAKALEYLKAVWGNREAIDKG